jgi:hypothetical protein
MDGKSEWAQNPVNPLAPLRDFAYSYNHFFMEPNDFRPEKPPPPPRQAYKWPEIPKEDKVNHLMGWVLLAGLFCQDIWAENSDDISTRWQGAWCLVLVVVYK